MFYPFENHTKKHTWMSCLYIPGLSALEVTNTLLARGSTHFCVLLLSLAVY